MFIKHNLIISALALSTGFISGWMVNGWRIDSQLAAREQARKTIQIEMEQNAAVFENITQQGNAELIKEVTKHVTQNPIAVRCDLHPAGVQLWNDANTRASSDVTTVWDTPNINQRQSEPHATEPRRSDQPLQIMPPTPRRFGGLH